MAPRVPLQAVDDLPEETYDAYVEPVVWAAVAFLVVYLIGRVAGVPAVTRVVRARNRRSPTLVQAVERYTRLAVLVVAAVAATVAAGYGHLLTGSAVVVAAVTLAIGVAGQEVIGNLVSGLFLVTDPDFNVGDWISWDGGEGVVETIRLRVTRVRTPNGEAITVPNTTLATTEVTRPYSRDRFRIVVRVGVDYDDDLDAARRVLREEAAATAGVRDDPLPRVEVDELGGDAVWLRAEFWIGQPTRRDVLHVRSEYASRAKEQLQAEGVTLAPPSGHEISGEITVDDASARDDRPDG